MVKFLQNIGKSLMLPIACLPVAGLMLRFGQPDVIEALGSGGFVQTVLPYFKAAGSALFNNLPLLFAVGVGVGLSDDQNGAAGLAGVITYLTLTNVTTEYWANNYTQSVAETLDISFLGGILAGVIAGFCYNKFRNTELPEFLSFFGGRRFVPIMAGLISIIVGIPLAIVWPSIQEFLSDAYIGIAEMGAFGVAGFMFFNRLLAPVGLHHILNSFFWFQLGEYNGVTGDLNRFFAGDPTAGHFMAGFFPVMMFGLPAVGLAIYFAAKKDKRKSVGGMLVSLTLTAFLTGVTEPIEFLFIFLSPVLLVVYALLTAMTGFIVDSLGILHGFTFSAGFIDYVMNFNFATKPILLLLVGLGVAVLYFICFYFLIIKLNLPTPGREEDIEEITHHKEVTDDYNELAKKYMIALGGRENLVKVDNCATRLRLEVKDGTLIQDQELKAIGAHGIVRLNKTNIQVIVGTNVEFIADAMKHLMR